MARCDIRRNDWDVSEYDVCSIGPEKVSAPEDPEVFGFAAHPKARVGEDAEDAAWREKSEG